MLYVIGYKYKAVMNGSCTDQQVEVFQTRSESFEPYFFGCKTVKHLVDRYNAQVTTKLVYFQSIIFWAVAFFCSIFKFRNCDF